MLANCAGACQQGRKPCPHPSRCGLYTQNGGASVDFDESAPLGAFQILTPTNALIAIVALIGVGMVLHRFNVF